SGSCLPSSSEDTLRSAFATAPICSAAARLLLSNSPCARVTATSFAAPVSSLAVSFAVSPRPAPCCLPPLRPGVSCRVSMQGPPRCVEEEVLHGTCQRAVHPPAAHGGRTTV